MIFLTPYPAYKDTGIEWLGQIPAHWEVRRLKRVAQINPSKSEVSNPMRDGHAVFLPMERVGADGQYDKSEIRPISELWNGFTYFRRGDIIIAKITPCFENGKGAWLENLPTEIGFGSTEFHVIRPHKEITAPYLYRITTLSEFRRLGTDAMTGAAGQQRVPAEFVANFSIPLPPLAEQAAIVRFLDFVDGRIRRYTHAQQRVIDRLTEYKQAVIHQAVTGKIDVRTGAPYPAYKDTGIEWLGQIPAHWEVHTFRQIARAVKGSQPQKLYLEHEAPPEAKPYLTMEYLRAPQGNAKFYCVPVDGDVVANAGDILLLWDGANAGEFFVAKEGVVSSTAALLQVAHCHTRYLYFVLKQCEPLLRAFSTGMGIPHVDGRTLRQMPIPLPPLAEQAAIVQDMDEQTARIDAAIAAVRRRLARVGEYRARLISDVVTGKLDVRAVAAGLPSDADAPTDTETYGEAYHVGDAVP